MKTKTPWVVLGGKDDEAAHCTRCGQGLKLVFPVDINVFNGAVKGFIKSHAKCRDTGRVDPVPKNLAEWLCGRDTGVSSKTIVAAMTGAQTDRASIPLDPSDFGRCYRLLKIMPEWRGQMRMVSRRFKEWESLVNAWDQLEKLWEEESPTGNCPKLYALMQKLESGK